MWIFTTKEFWLSLWSNALADLFVGVILGTLFATVIGKWIESRSAADLYLHAEDPTTGQAFTSSLYSSTPFENDPSFVDFQLRIENQGTIAAINWLITLEFPMCRSRQDTSLIEFRLLNSQTEPFSPAVELRHESKNKAEFLRFQYASLSDMIHSGYKQFAPTNLRFRIFFHPGYEEVMRDGLATPKQYRKRGRYTIYADHMRTRTGQIGLWVDMEKRKASLHFDLWD